MKSHTVLTVNHRLPVLRLMPPQLKALAQSDAKNTNAARAEAGAACAGRSKESGAVALLEFFATATRARVVAANVFQFIAHGLLRGVAAVWAVHVAVIVIVVMRVMVMIVVTVWAMNVGLLGHYLITLE